MLKNLKKITSLTMVLALALSASACGGGSNSGGNTATEAPAKNDTAATAKPAEADKATDAPKAEATDAPATEEPPEPGSLEAKYLLLPDRDLNGREVIIGNWWGDWDTEEYEASSDEQEGELGWRIDIQKRYNTRIREKNVGTYGEFLELASTSILAGTPTATVYTLAPAWYSSLQKQGMWAPLNGGSVDFNSDEFINWSRPTTEATTSGGKTYGMSVDIGGMSGVYFNKRLLEEAGVNPESIYDMQRDGTWTWDAFLELCKKTTRDTDNDGIIDVYAIATRGPTILDVFLPSNLAGYISMDASGKYVNGSKTPNFLETVQFAMNLNTQGYMMPQPEGTEWNWYEQSFKDGKAAFSFGGTYLVGGLQGEAGLKDDFGFVCAPKGPKADKYYFNKADNVFAVPSTYSQQEVDDIVFAYMVWMMYAGGKTGDMWKAESYPNYDDKRAVDETLMYSYSGENGYPNYAAYIPSFPSGEVADHLWDEGVDAASLIESADAVWQAALDEFNQ